ncbi:MAG: hypothetical protein IID03_12560 [Candidatus Dadabacteria bacterium]|nr:hypothetical protein [Candidatus Dadabacteria bacterium]
MQINKQLFKLAIKLEEFQKFMTSEIKVTDEEFKKLKGCRACLTNFKWTDRTIKKVNAHLEKLDKENKLEAPKAMTSNHKITRDKEEAIEFIQASDGDLFQIIIRKK